MSSPDPYAQPYSKPSDAAPYYQPNHYAPQPGAVPPYPQGPYPAQQQPGAMPYYPSQQGMYPPAMPYGAPYANMAPDNPRATGAMTYGLIAIALSVFTFFINATGAYIGIGGLITGTFAVIYGFQGLSWAKRLPNNAGQGKSLTGVILGFIALGIVVLSILIAIGSGAV